MDAHILQSKAIEEVRHAVSLTKGIAGDDRVYEQGDTQRAKKLTHQILGLTILTDRDRSFKPIKKQQWPIVSLARSDTSWSSVSNFCPLEDNKSWTERGWDGAIVGEMSKGYDKMCFFGD